MGGEVPSNGPDAQAAAAQAPSAECVSAQSIEMDPYDGAQGKTCIISMHRSKGAGLPVTS